MNKPTRTLAILCAAAATAALGGTYSWNVTTGGALDAKDMVHNFLGRDYNLDAVKQWHAE